MIRASLFIAAQTMVLSASVLAVTASAQNSEQVPPAGVSRADLFIASFGPSASEQSLRTSELEMREQVRLAFYGIDATRVEVEKGRLSPSEGDRIVDSFQQTLRNVSG